ncbi:hypothetical protein GCM10009665_48240 [Kitasatospora nipponensis]|uniref:Secreted protein n=1 Tax=Kitasatospora nipponensis TaxID=258049 RepID=A0ABP4H9X1_9ACTN
MAGEKKFCQFWVTCVVAAATSAGALPVDVAEAAPVAADGEEDADPDGAADGLLAAGVGVPEPLLLLLEQEATSSRTPSTATTVRRPAGRPDG